MKTILRAFFILLLPVFVQAQTINWEDVSSNYEFPLNIPKAGEYEIYSWWTSHSNRAADTPYFITHAGGTTEVAVNQSIAGSMWNLFFSKNP